jgi:Transposase IS200 like
MASFLPMPRRLRFVPPGSLVEITCRTVQGRWLLRPSPILTDVTLGVLARAARLYPVEVHAFAFLSNHYHLLLTVPSAQRLAQFMNYLNSNLAREAGRLIRWREKFWGRRYQAILVSNEEDAQVARLRYLLAHGAKEGLVASPLDWPGAHCARALAAGSSISGRWHDRTLEFKTSRRSLPLDPEAFVEHEHLALAPIPCWQHLDPGSYRSLIRDLIREIELSARAELEATGREPVGQRALLLQNPHHEPNRIKKGPAPIAHAASRPAREAIRSAYRAFIDAFRAAASRLKAGILDASFPIGSFPPALAFQEQARTG